MQTHESVEFTTLIQQTAQAYLSDELCPDKPTKEQILAASTTTFKRAEGDLWALFQRYHDAALFAAQLPDAAQPRTLFFQAERLRLLQLCPDYYLGTRQNIRRLLNKLAKQEATTLSTPLKKLYESLHQSLTVTRLSDKSPFNKLKQLCSDQKAFGHAILALLTQDETEKPNDAPSLRTVAASDASQDNQEEPSKNETDLETLWEAFLTAHTTDNTQKSETSDESADSHHSSAKRAANARSSERVIQPYRIYTRQFDEIKPISAYVSEQYLQELSRQLEEKGAPLLPLITPMAKKLRASLQRAFEHQHTHSTTEGARLNKSSLARFIADPTYPVWQYPLPHKTKPAAITLLLDNSGSMRGQPILMTALCAHLLNWALAPFGIPLEVIGYTTVNWQGGQSFNKWKNDGKPKFPGRLNETRHIIYKSFESPATVGAKNIGGMLDARLLKENIDGEALQLAYKRLAHQEATKKILVVISDGAPVEDMTLAHNTPQFLDDHLASVVHQLSKNPHLTLLAIGIGHDVSAYYPRAITLRKLEELGTKLFGALINFLQKT